MSANLKKENGFESFLKSLHISEKGRHFLMEQEFDEETLKRMQNKNIDTELQHNGFTLAKGDRTRLKTWRKSLNVASQKKNSRSPHSQTKKNSPNHPPPMYRQNSVSEELLHEIVRDPSQRKLLDSLMKHGIHGMLYEGKPVFLHRHDLHGFYSDLKQGGESLYYRWDIKRDNGAIAEAFHLSLNHTKNERHTNRTGHNRDVVGALHVRFGTGNRHFRRILVNLVNGTYELTVCVKKTPYDETLDAFAKKIINVLVDYYVASGRDAKTMYDNGRGPKRGISRC